MGPIHLGLLIPKIKKEKMKLPDRIQEDCLQENIKVTEIDFFKDIGKQGPFDVLLHKIVDFHKETSDYEQTETLIAKAMEYAKQNPQMYVVDDFDVVRNLMNRTFQFELLEKCKMTVDGIKVYVPKSFEISAGTGVEDCKTLIRNSGIKFPILAKPLDSCLKSGAHDITIVFSIENLKDIPIPCLLQEFCNHGGVIYKVFVLGDRVNFCERPSVQNVDCSSSRKSIVFDTRDVSKTGKAFIPELHGTDPNLRKWLSCHDKPDMLNKNVIMSLQRKMSELADLKVYGLDILVDCDGNYALVDLNHFPGFTGVKEEFFSKSLVELIKQCTKK